MSRIPDCRSDAFYNYGHLTDEDKYIVDGYDRAADILEAALDFATDSDSLIEHLMETELPDSLKDEDVNTARDFILTLMTNYFESTRDEMITGMIDGYACSKGETDGNI